MATRADKAEAARRAKIERRLARIGQSVGTIRKAVEGGFARIEAEMEAMRAEVVGPEPAPAPEPEPGPVPEPPPPGVPRYIGGEPGVDGRRVIEGKVFRSGISLEDYAGVDLVAPVFDGVRGEPCIRDKPGHGARVFDAVFKGCRPAEDGFAPVVYINPGLSRPEESAAVVMQRFRFEGCHGTHAFEGKLSGYAMVDWDAEGSDLPGGIRVRRGFGALILDCKGIRQATFRGHDHVLAGLPGCKAVAYSGNLEAEWAKWEKVHNPGGMNNMQRADRCYVERVGSVYVGYVTSPEYRKYPARDITVHPDQKNVFHEGDLPEGRALLCERLRREARPVRAELRA